MTKTTQNTQTNILKQPTYWLSVVLVSVLSIMLTAVFMWFFVTDQVNDYRGSIISDIKAASAVVEIKK
jgi:hypothetical protein